MTLTRRRVILPTERKKDNMPKQKTVPTIEAPMKTYSIKVDEKLMDKAVKLGVNTAKIMRNALEKETAALEGMCPHCKQPMKKVKKS